MKVEHWNLGPELDGRLVASIRQLLVELRFDQIDYWEGIGGSQAISHWEYENAEGRLVLEAETFIGVTLEGPTPLVKKVREAFETSQQSASFREKH